MQGQVLSERFLTWRSLRVVGFNNRLKLKELCRAVFVCANGSSSMAGEILCGGNEGSREMFERRGPRD